MTNVRGLKLSSLDRTTAWVSSSQDTIILLCASGSRVPVSSLVPLPGFQRSLLGQSQHQGTVLLDLTDRASVASLLVSFGRVCWADLVFGMGWLFQVRVHLATSHITFLDRLLLVTVSSAGLSWCVLLYVLI